MGELDLRVESGGKCFLCWKPRRSPAPGSGSWTTLGGSAYYSIQYLSRYLKMEVGKVISAVGVNEGKGDEEGGGGADRSRLKVELCPECAILSEALAELFQQLEKVEMEMVECLTLIHGKLKKVPGSRTRSSKGGRRGRGRSKREMVEELRMEAMTKCSRKLKTISPRVRLPKLNLKKMTLSAKVTKVTGTGTSQDLDDDDLPEYLIGKEDYFIPEPELSYAAVSLEALVPVIKMEQPDSDIKLEPQFEDPTPPDLKPEVNDDQEQEINFLDDLIIPPPHRNLVAPKNSKFRSRLLRFPQSTQWKGAGRNNLTTIECDICHLRVPNLYSHLVSSHANSTERHVEEPVKGAPTTTPKYSFSVSFPPNLPQRFRQTFPISTLNPASDKHECHLCPMRFATRLGFVYHYKSVHLQIKYACGAGTCTKVFLTRTSYNRHHLIHHAKLNFNCDRCSKSFTQSCHLQRHQRSAACDADLKVSGKLNGCRCRLCGREFLTPHMVQMHLKREHGHLWKFHCDICKKRFKRKDVLDRHRKIHETAKNRRKLERQREKDDATWSINSKS